jgi:N-acetylmuramoyl-L-alanine amidase
MSHRILILLCLFLAPTLARAELPNEPTTRPNVPSGYPKTLQFPKPTFSTKPGQPLSRQGDEIIVCGQLFHTGAPVILWTDPGGYDAYRVERRFAPYDQSFWVPTTQATTITNPARYNLRESVLSPKEIEKVRGGGWDLPLLQDKVDQFVLHYDVCGLSRICFQTLHDSRGLSVHFMLDIDGTIYQTLDLKERAWHATISNSRSIGIEIANLGAYTANESDPFKQWYARDSKGKTHITIPDRFGDGGIRTLNFTPRPVRQKLIWGEVQNHNRRQWDFTPEQYDSLIKLTATLCTVFPKIKCDYPKDDKGKLITRKLPDDQLEKYQGILGHYHIQQDKADPGPAMNWDLLVHSARKLINPSYVMPLLQTDPDDITVPEERVTFPWPKKTNR